MNYPRHRPLAWTYATVTALSLFLFVVFWNASNIIRVDFLGTNPHRSQANALFIAVVEGPITGFAFVAIGGSLCIATSAITAKLTDLFFGRVPIWALPINTLACCAAFYVQIRWGFQPSYDGGTVTPGSPHPFGLVAGYVYILLTLMSAWWLTCPAEPDNSKENLPSTPK